jgi:glycosyltransferase involved in cell wall biosynthesis
LCSLLGSAKLSSLRIPTGAEGRTSKCFNWDLLGPKRPRYSQPEPERVDQEPSYPPQVTVCVPAFNAAATIGPSLESVLAQGLPGIEIVVVDNCSTDGTAEVVGAALHGVPRARLVVNSENIGRIPNWNRCLELAGGRYIKFLMANDVLFSGSLALLLHAAARHPRTVIVGSQHEAWDGQPGPIPHVRADARMESWHGRQTLEYVRDGGNPFWALNGALLLREAIADAHLSFEGSEPYYADVRFCAELAVHGTTTFIHTPTYRFNKSIRTRFHYTGDSAGEFFGGMRRYYDLVNRRLEEGGLPIANSLPRLYDGLHYRLFDEGWGVSPSVIHEIFSENLGYEMRALRTWLKWKLRLHRAERPLRRLARKLRGR